MANPYQRQYNEAVAPAPSNAAVPPAAPADENPFSKYAPRLNSAPAASASPPSRDASNERFLRYLQDPALAKLPVGAVLIDDPREVAQENVKDPMTLLPTGSVLLPDDEQHAVPTRGPRQGKNPFEKYATPQPNIFDQFDEQQPSKPQAPAKSGNIFDQFDEPQQAHSSNAPSSEDWQQYLSGIARSIAQGATFNWSDELESLGRTMFGGDRELARARIRDEVERFRERHPYVALGSELAGAIAIPGAAGARVGARLAGAGAGFLRKAAAGGAIGVAEGALSGAGSVEGPLIGSDPTQTAIGAGTGAVVGGALGAAIPGAGHIVGRMFEGSSGKANRLIRDAMIDDATLAGRRQQRPTEIIRAAADRDVRLAPTRGAPSEATLATLGGERVQGLAREASQQSIPAQAMARAHVDELRAARPGQKEFEKVYAAPPITSATLDALIANRPALKQARALALRNLSDLGVTPPSGAYSPQMLHEMDRALRDASTRLWQGGQSARATAVDSARQQLQGIIEKKMPALAAAQTRYAAGSELLRRAPQATDISQRISDPAASAAKNILGAGLSLSMGHKASAMNRIMNWAMGNSAMSPNIAEAVMRILLTKARNTEAFERMLSDLDRMNAPRRSTYLASAIIADQAGKMAGGKTGQQY